MKIENKKKLLHDLVRENVETTWIFSNGTWKWAMDESQQNIEKQKPIFSIQKHNFDLNSDISPTLAKKIIKYLENSRGHFASYSPIQIHHRDLK